MARLPAPEDYGLTTPRATGSPAGHSALRATPDTATGKVMLGLGVMLQEEADKLDETVALDALNQLQNKQLDLTYGDDGFTKLQGKAVIDRKITDEYPANLQKEVERLQGTIGSTAAKSKFQERAAGLLRQFKVGVYTHAGKETETFQQQAVTGAIATGTKFAQAGDFAAGISHALPVVEAEVARRGLEGDAADKFRRDALGPIYSTGIKTMLASGQSSQASELLENAKPHMPADQVAHFDTMVKEQTSYDKAGALVDEARAKGLTEVQAMDFFRAQAKGDKATAETAKGLFSQYENADRRAEAQVLAPLQLSFLDSGGGFAAQAKVIKSPEYINAPEKVQVQIRDYMTNHARAMQSFGRSEEAYWENKKASDPEVLTAFQNVAGSPETLALYDAAQLQVLMLPVLGRTRTADLLKYKRIVEEEAKKFKIPKDLVEQAMPPTLQKAKTGAQAQQKDRFEGLVTEGLMDWKLANPGKQPDAQQQQEIIAGAARKISTPGPFFGLGTAEYNAYEFKPMAVDFVEAAQSKAQREKGRKLTQTELQNLWALQKDAKIK